MYLATSGARLRPRPRRRCTHSHSCCDTSDRQAAPFAVLVDSLTYVYSALTLRRLDVADPAPRTGVSLKNLRGEVVEGFRWAYGGSGLFTLAMFTHAWFVGHTIVMVLLAPCVLSVLGLTAFQFGLITTIGVIGFVLAGSGGARAGTFALLALGQGLYGLAMGMSNSHEMSYRQLVTPDELQARTNTTLRSLNRTVVVVASPLAGLLAFECVDDLPQPVTRGRVDLHDPQEALLLSLADEAVVLVQLALEGGRRDLTPIDVESHQRTSGVGSGRRRNHPHSRTLMDATTHRAYHSYGPKRMETP